MKCVHIIVYILYSLTKIESLKCPSNDRCQCYPGTTDFEFQCPKHSDNPDYIIHVSETDFLIDCKVDMKKFDINMLPNITLPNVENFRIRTCPLPEHNFKEILDHFSINSVYSLHYRLTAITELSSSYFQGLESLQHLALDSNELENIDYDFLKNTPNLLILDLHHNKIQLKHNWLKFTPNLKYLDLSENGIDSIADNLFQALPNLESLDLWSNNLNSINDLTFNGLTKLKTLNLNLNKIETISDRAFNSLTNLARINLSSNKLTALSNIFANNAKIFWIVINYNPNLQLSEDVFSNLPALQEIDLKNCNLKILPETIFQNSTNIASIDLSNNHLENISKNTFNDLMKLEVLHLEYNRITEILDTFSYLKKLRTLYLNDNQIINIGNNAFSGMVNLANLMLQHNQISQISIQLFRDLLNLRKIDISNNQIHTIETILDNKLFNTINIESINLSNNKITNINNIVNLHISKNLTELNLSQNAISEFWVGEFQLFYQRLNVYLENNSISVVNLDNVDTIVKQNAKDALSGGNSNYVTIYLNNNPLVCNCFNYKFCRYLQDLEDEIKAVYRIISNHVCQNPVELQNLLLETVPLNKLICSFEDLKVENECPEKCSCSYRPFDLSDILDCSNRNLTEYPTITSLQNAKVSQIEFHLEENFLKSGPNSTYNDFNITQLYLSNNEIEEFDWLPLNISILHLDNNRLSHFEPKILHKLSALSMKNLTLQNNPWTCNCDAVNFTNFLRDHIKIVDSNQIYCSNSSRRLIDLHNIEICPVFQAIYLLLILLLLALLIAICFVGYYRYQEPLKVWLFAHNLCLWWVTEEELDKDKLYDAFISYSHKDEDFVVQNLLPVLENSTNPYKICIHFRDFIPGEFIATQVTNSILESRRTIVILSKNFLDSVWGKMEFRTAHTQAMTEGRARVIIILYDDIDMDKLDEELKAYLKTNTYVKWEDPYFWNKLKYALPHSKSLNGNNNNQKMTNVMNYIDDKFNLVVPITESGNTTPMSNGNAVKENPLKFVSNTNFNPHAVESGTLLVSNGV